jgi:hypothetical protein
MMKLEVPDQRRSRRMLFILHEDGSRKGDFHTEVVKTPE